MGHFFVYILYSEKYPRSYVGQTNDLETRLKRHNNGGVRSTRPYRPWLRIHYEVYNTRAEAMKRERWYKTGRGNARVKELIAGYLMGKTAIASSEGGRPDEIGACRRIRTQLDCRIASWLPIQERIYFIPEGCRGLRPQPRYGNRSSRSSESRRAG